MIRQEKNSIFGGNNIQSYFDNGSLYTRISDGSFDDLFIGDYFTAPYNGTNKTFRIAGFDLDKNHAIIVPDKPLLNTAMNPTNTTAGGYVGSNMYKNTIGEVTSVGNINTINGNLYNIFGAHLLTTRELLSNSDGLDWYDCQAVLMSEVEVYGSTVFSSSGYDTGNANMQLPLFRLMPKMKNPGRYWYWLKSVADSSNFCCVYSGGYSSCLYASLSLGVRPRFAIG